MSGSGRALAVRPGWGVSGNLHESPEPGQETSGSGLVGPFWALSTSPYPFGLIRLQFKVFLLFDPLLSPPARLSKVLGTEPASYSLWELAYTAVPKMEEIYKGTRSII